MNMGRGFHSQNIPIESLFLIVQYHPISPSYSHYKKPIVIPIVIPMIVHYSSTIVDCFPVRIIIKDY